MVSVVKPFLHANINIEPSTQVDSVAKTTASVYVVKPAAPHNPKTVVRKFDLRKVRRSVMNVWKSPLYKKIVL